MTGAALKTETEPSEFCVIKIAVSKDLGPLASIIENFNTSDNGYKIECRNYDEYFDSTMDTENGSSIESFSQIDNQIVLDLIKGEDIDIVTDMFFADKGRFNELI